MNNLTLAQMAWLRKHPKYSPRRAPSRGSLPSGRHLARRWHVRAAWTADESDQAPSRRHEHRGWNQDGQPPPRKPFLGLPAQPPSTPRRQIESRSIGVCLLQYGLLGASKNLGNSLHYTHFLTSCGIDKLARSTAVTGI